MWNSIRELPLSGSSASVALMVSTVCPTGVSSDRLYVPYCKQIQSEPWGKQSHGRHVQKTRALQTYITLLKQRHLVVDVNDLDDDLTDRAENCDTKEINTCTEAEDLRLLFLHPEVFMLPGSLTLTWRLYTCWSFRWRMRNVWILPEVASIEKVSLALTGSRDTME